MKFFNVEEQTILVLVQIVEANGTLEATLESGKSDRADGAIIVATSQWLGILIFLLIVVAASRWPNLLVFLIIIVVLLLDRLLLCHLLLGHLLLGRLLPQERDKPCHHDFSMPKIFHIFFGFLIPRS
jgi:hypothetical protein